MRVTLPVLLGAALLALGGSADLLYHAAPAWLVAALEPVLGSAGGRAHLLTLLGMVVVLAGVAWRGLHARRPE